MGSAYCELISEVLTMFDMAKGQVSCHKDDQIQFQLYGVLHHMCYIEFTIHLSLYNSNFIQTSEYDVLLISGLHGEYQESYWSWISINSVINPHWLNATFFHSPALR